MMIPVLNRGGGGIDNNNKYYLYTRGSQVVSWGTGDGTYYAGYTLDRATMMSDRVYLRSYTRNESYSIFITTAKIDISDYKYLKAKGIKGSATRGTYFGMYINNNLQNVNAPADSNARVDFRETSETGEVEISLDIQSYNSSYYIVLVSDNYRSGYFTEVWLEK